MRVAPVFTGFSLLLAAVLFSPALSALDSNTLWDPRPSSRWSLDQSGRLDSATLAALDDLGRTIKSSTAHEQVVVCVDSTDGENQRTFATRLFNRWQLGNRSRNDGVLLFVALNDRRVEFILGDGVDSDAQVALTQRIIDQDMLPRFRAGDPQAAVLAGARASARQVLGLTTAATPTTTANSATVLRIEQDAVLVEQPVERDGSALANTGPSAPLTARPPSSSASGYSTPSAIDSTWLFWGLAGGGGGSGIAGFLLWRRWLRNRPRTCDRCQQPMMRLGEHEDDQHLNHSEKTEERVGSVDYDIWCCSACPHVMKLRYGTWFTSYARCPRCHAVTKSSNETTLIAATYDHGGQVRVDDACVACDYRHSYIRSTPQKTRPSTGNRSGFSAGGFGGGGRSGGSSGGGGRSSGRGGGGGW